MYHDLTLYPEECDDMTITAKRMENDLKWLADNNYTAILPRELNTLIEEKKLTEKHVMITFDDGYLSNYELLFPLLKKYKKI